jgi:type III restriction enzyme
MDFQLKDFQKRTLGKLGKFFGEVRLYGDAARAFANVAEEKDGLVPLYRTVPGLENVPYVCLRLPTGGGKTILGAYAIRVAAKNYIEKDYPLVLWLVPSNTIRTQTAKALKDPTHPYRQALDEEFEGHVRVFDIEEIENIRPQDISEKVCIVVATIQTLRVSDRAGRDVYADKEALEAHFTRLNTRLPELDRIDSGPYAGRMKYSFANLMMIHRPMVIMDEAHNARTHLTFEILNRIAPCCIVELTATPDNDPRTGSNVLCRVSAAELKAEAMIKLPIVLTEHTSSWESALSDALRMRRRLAALAEGESQYIRPILLIQAENQDRTANVEAVKQYLLENERIPEERIAIATGTQRELEGIDLFKPTCPIEIIITVQALKEGWDCSFAYVFCSTANIHNATSVEQLLGRVLRMPYVQRRKADDLNKAYAHVSSPNFSEAASQLETSMVALGFDAAEAAQAIERGLPSSGGLPLFDAPVVIELSAPPDLNSLTEKEHEQVILQRHVDGKATIEIVGPVTEPMREKIIAAVAPADRTAVEQRLREYTERPKRVLTPSERRDAFIVPRLCARFDGQLRLFDEDLILDAYSWDLLAYKPSLSNFHYDPATRTFELDVDGGRIRTKYIGTDQLDLSLMPVEWTETDLVRWLDKELRQDDVSQEKMEEWIRRAVRELLASKRFDLSVLVRAKYLLCRELLGAITKSREAAKRNAYQELLFGPSAALETSFNYAIEYDPKNYLPNWTFESGYHWTRHYYPKPGELKGEGEEFECAKALDAQEEVLYWVRNLAGQKLASFWLKTSTDLFYPDFVAILKDGRALVVEYKGEHFSDSADTLEKRNLGEKYQDHSHGKALFLMAVKKDGRGRGVYDQIRDKIAGKA